MELAYPAEPQLAADVSCGVMAIDLESGDEVAEGRTKLSKPGHLVSGRFG